MQDFNLEKYIKIMIRSISLWKTRGLETCHVTKRYET